jgi:hypothetical protein
MERAVNLEQMAAAEHADLARWRARGAVDGARHFPTNEQDVQKLAEEMRLELVVPVQQREAGELQASLAITLGSCGALGRASVVAER